MANSPGFVSYFGTELRRHRERMGWCRDELAERVPWSVWTIASVEQARRKPPPGLGEHLDALFGLPEVMTNLAEEAQKDNAPFGDRVDLEQRALSICEYDMRVVPGLLQTEAYAMAINDVPGRDVSSAEVERVVRIRMQRQDIFNRESPPTFHAVIDEAVLCRRIGSPAVMREQLIRLVSPHHGVIVQILPFSAGSHDSLRGPFTIMRLPGEPDVGYTEGWVRGHAIDTPTEVIRAQRTFEQLAALALPPDLSTEMIQAYAERGWI